MQALARLVVTLFGLWLIGVGTFSLVDPLRALQLLGKMASTYRINFAEQGLRLLAGIALVVRAEESSFAGVLSPLGWFLVVTSLLLMIVPLRWHARYAVWWSEHLRPAWVRLAAPVSIAAGLLLIYAAI